MLSWHDGPDDPSGADLYQQAHERQARDDMRTGWQPPDGWARPGLWCPRCDWGVVEGEGCLRCEPPVSVEKAA